VQDVDFEENVLRVELQLERRKRGAVARGLALKSERGRREVDLLPDLVTILKQHKAEAFKRGHAKPEDFVFTTAEGGPLYYRNVTRDFGTPADRAGLNPEGGAAPGDARSSAYHDLALDCSRARPG
jgi:hypothetical protein